MKLEAGLVHDWVGIIFIPNVKTCRRAARRSGLFRMTFISIPMCANREPLPWETLRQNFIGAPK